MDHPLVTQLHFARKEFVRCFDGVTPEEAVRRVEPMNSLSWVVGHVAQQENFFWIRLAQGKILHPELRERVGFMQPPTTPPMEEMWDVWREITASADEYLRTVRPGDLDTAFLWEGKPYRENVGRLLLRCCCHYWFHLGKAHSVRQMMGHKNLPVYVGDLSAVEYAADSSSR